jgi:hypothetical protein
LSRVRTLNRAVLRRRSHLDPSQGDLNSWNSPLRGPFPVQRSGKILNSCDFVSEVEEAPSMSSPSK